MRTLVGTCVIAIGCGSGSSTPDASRNDSLQLDADIDGNAIDAPDANTGSGVRVGGTAFGIRAPVEVTLTVDSASHRMIVTEDGAFRFPRKFLSGTYSVTETSADCVIENGTGTLTGSEVTNVSLICRGVVELGSIAFAPNVVRLATTFDPGAPLTYTATRPFFADATDTITVTPTALYPALASLAINAAPASSGQPSVQPYNAQTPVALAYGSAFANIYTFATTPEVSFEAYVKASDTAMQAGFGSGQSTACMGATNKNGNGVALSGDTLVVGSPCINVRAGAAYVYRRTGTTWAFEAKLTPTVADMNDLFGTSVAIDGDSIVVGAFGEASSNGTATDNAAPNAGAAYVFTRSGTAWSQQAYLKATNIDAADRFGTSVAIAGDTVIVGAPGESSSGTGINGTANNTASAAGAAYIFTRSGTTWSQQAYVKASNTGANDAFGTAVAIASNTAVVGAPNEDGATGDDGAVYVFVRNGTTWSQQGYLKASNAGASDTFGTSVAVDGNLLIGGAPGEDGNGSLAENDSGAAYVFTRNGTTWTEDAMLFANTRVQSGGFGQAVAIDRTHAVVGSRLAGNGIIQAYRRSATAWDTIRFRNAPNMDVAGLDEFGSSVAADGDTFAAGAFKEDSNATNVGGNGADNSATDSGAVYVFR
ncbi:MAG TPA: FG-GAP repeat protein [Kofleriaceae bacterium]|nr:FG-GAP repeat protein [Kofleriaceae bacterium]